MNVPVFQKEQLLRVPSVEYTSCPSAKVMSEMLCSTPCFLLAD